MEVRGFKYLKNHFNFLGSHGSSKRREKQPENVEKFCIRDAGKEKVRRRVVLYQFLSDLSVKRMKDRIKAIVSSYPIVCFYSGGLLISAVF